ncbi:hypothetical protein G3567_03190 [Psychroflexus sp. YR1-1]|uniref:Uncharacterized protein n=1 Tax=Psychroflexus aurantiacus TaxID=2709310 RepID=A0A6B3QZ90_9FLAO|nr:hypothetical protein [Psychroflexus aurantiacus]NEV93152.1 hypothetical protein [Psychroflexus aurantiacus]
MKLFAIYFLISSIGLQPLSSGLLNVGSLPKLVQHYELHKTQYNNSVIEFLYLHYGFQKESHADQHQDHEDLPFQQDQIISSSFYFVNPAHFILGCMRPDEKIKHNFDYKMGFTFLSLPDILQPPKSK